MQRFRYTARNVDGRNMSGEVVAVSREEVAHRLQEAGVYVTSVKAVRWTRPVLRLSPGRVPQEDLLVFLESWAMFLEAGLSMQSSLLRLRMRARVPALARGIENMMLALDSGATVSEGLRASRLLPASWVSVVQIAEKDGDYSRPLRMLYKNCLDFQRFKRELLYQMIMPFVLLIMMAVCFWILLGKVIPSLVLLLAQTGGALSVPGWVVMFFHGVMSSTQWLVPLAIVVLLLFCFWIKQISQEGGMSQLWIPHSTPLFGPLVRQMQLILFAKALQVQLEAGIPFVAAMESLSDGVSNHAVKRDMLTVCRKLHEGAQIPEALADFDLIPQMGQALLMAGHASGKMPEMLGCLVQESQSMLVEEIKRLTIYIRSIVIIVSGLAVGVVVILFFMLLFGAMGSVGTSGKSSFNSPG